MDFARARHAMVESQIRPSDVTEPALLGALRSLPREAFVPATARAQAYADLEADVGRGRRLLRPRDLGKLLMALAPRPGEKALEIAGATAYGAAVLAACGCTVTTLDSDPELCRAARGALEAAGQGAVTAVSTELRLGWPEAAPYDVMFLNGAAEVVPAAWFDQLAEGGRLAVIVREGPAGTARLYRKHRGVVSFLPVFDAAPPVTPGLEAPPQFRF